MNRVGIRDKLANAIEAWKTATALASPVFYENTTVVDLDAQPDVFLTAIVDFLGAEQINISPTPDTRFYGNLEVTAYTRETLGTRAILSLLDGAATYFGYKNLSGVHVGVPSIGTSNSRTPRGWHGITLIVPFYSDSNA